MAPLFGLRCLTTHYCLSLAQVGWETAANKGAQLLGAQGIRMARSCDEEHGAKGRSFPNTKKESSYGCRDAAAMHSGFNDPYDTVLARAAVDLIDLTHLFKKWQAIESAEAFVDSIACYLIAFLIHRLMV